MGEVNEDTNDVKEASIITEAKEIKRQMIEVISSLHEKYGLDQIMPLVDLLKILDHKIITNNLEEAERNVCWDKAFIKGEDSLNVQTTISNLVNLIHIENALLVGINNALVYSLSANEGPVFLAKIHSERRISYERKKLFIIILKHVLLKDSTVNKVKSNGGELHVDHSILENDLMNLIKVNCKICSKVLGSSKNNAIDQFCACKVYEVKRDILKVVSGVLEISMSGFVGHYNYKDLNNIFNGSRLPCSSRGDLKVKCECLGRPNSKCVTTSQYERKVVINIDKRFVLSSEWSKTKVKGLTHKAITLSRKKELEIQVWESQEMKCRNSPLQYLIAVAILPLEGLTYSATKKFTINMEPAGLIDLELSFSPKVESGTNVPDITHKIRRRLSIMRKFNEYKQSKMIKQNININALGHFFSNRIRNTLKRTKFKIVIDDNQVCLVEKKTLCIKSTKLNITPPNSKKHSSSVTVDKYINFSTKANSRLIVPFIHNNKNALFESQKKVVPLFAPLVLEESVSFIDSKDIESRKIEFITQSPLKANGKAMLTSTPLRNTTLPSNNLSLTTHVMQKTYSLNKSLMTRSNLDLSVLEDVSEKSEENYSDDEGTKNDYESPNSYLEEPTFMRIRKVVLTSEDNDLNPTPCSPGMKNIANFIIDSSHKSMTKTLKDSWCNSSISGRFMDSLFENSTISEVEQPDRVNTPYEVLEVFDDLEIEHINLVYDDFELLSVLGQGNFGKVLLVKYLKPPKINGLCAIKVINKKMIQSSDSYDTIMSERNILMIITAAMNPFLVGLIGCFQTESYLIFAIEYACGGDLMGHIHKAAFMENNARFYSACVLLALDFLHSNNIMYRDIKLENLLMDAQGYVKLTDFGLSKMNMDWNSTTRTYCGTPEFLAPEILKNEPYTRVVDWWAFGVLLYEMILGQVPFEGESDDEIFVNVKGGFIRRANLSSEALTIIKRLLQLKPTRRLGYGENGTNRVRSQVFYKNTNWTAMMERTVIPPLLPNLANDCDTHYFESEFTSMDVTINHGDEYMGDNDIDQNIFNDFDTVVNWDNFLI